MGYLPQGPGVSAKMAGFSPDMRLKTPKWRQNAG
jgi:hypothetical protein